MKLTRRSLFVLPCAAWICPADQNPTWRTRVADDSEPGDRLVIRGRLLKSPGGSPSPGTTIMVYQTDAKGIYGQGQGRPADIARLRGQFTTGPSGEFEIITIKPGPYPGGGVPAHIHVNVVEMNKEPREIFEYFFAGDPYLKGGEKGYVLKLQRDAERAWRASQDVALSQ